MSPATIAQRKANVLALPEGWERRVLMEYIDNHTDTPETGLPPFGRRVAMWATHFDHLIRTARDAENPEEFLSGALYGWHKGDAGKKSRLGVSYVLGVTIGANRFDIYRWHTRIIPPLPHLWEHNLNRCISCRNLAPRPLVS